MPQSLSFLVWNVENMFLLSEQNLTEEHLSLDGPAWSKLSISLYENKPLKKLKEIQKMLQRHDPDVVALCEVGGLESLENFNRLFLQSKYSVALVEGNSDRQIDIGFLVKKSPEYHLDLQSNRTRSLNFLYPHEVAPTEEFHLVTSTQKESHRFSRDAAELRLFRSSSESPFLIFVLAHLKSRLDPDGIDPRGSLRRAAELKTLLEIYSELEQKHPTVPIVLAGDFNGAASGPFIEPEFLPLAQTQLQDVCELAGIKPEDRWTFLQINRNKVEPLQLDYAFLSPVAQKYLDVSSVKVLTYIDDAGEPLPTPRSLREKLDLPSDHQPLFFRLNFS